MAFLRSETLRVRLNSIVDPFDMTRVKHGAYELSLGTEVLISGETKKTVYPVGEQISIPPGQFALLITKEIVRIPDDLIALISIKFTSKRLGLVNISGFHVDPGFDGRLKYSVYNAGPAAVPLTVGEPLFLIWFALLDAKTADVRPPEPGEWVHITNRDVRDNQGEVASPEQLRKKLDGIERTGKVVLTLAVPILIFTIIQVVQFVWRRFEQPSQSASQQILVVPMPVPRDNQANSWAGQGYADSVIVYSDTSRVKLGPEQASPLLPDTSKGPQATSSNP